MNSIRSFVDENNGVFVLFVVFFFSIDSMYVINTVRVDHHSGNLKTQWADWKKEEQWTGEVAMEKKMGGKKNVKSFYALAILRIAHSVA